MRRFLLCLLALAARPLSAQFDSATVLGLVRDSSGLGIPKAKLKLTNVRTGIEASAEADGAG
ncbi:MAG: carboxypeptidase-like regulatory domain-containing protein, partial [Acidobacteriota bacterium]